jgi:hypothetical protein
MRRENERERDEKSLKQTRKSIATITLLSRTNNFSKSIKKYVYSQHNSPNEFFPPFFSTRFFFLMN